MAPRRESLGPCGTCGAELWRPVSTVRAREGLHHLRCWQRARDARLEALHADPHAPVRASDLRSLAKAGASISSLMGLLYTGRGLAQTRGR